MNGDLRMDWRDIQEVELPGLGDGLDVWMGW